MQIEPFADDVPLAGEDAPTADQIDDLIKILVTTRKRFGNTAVRYSVQWGGSALQVRDKQRAEIERLEKWVADLQSGMYINCVYCGHRYGPQDEVPATMADALTAHVAVCLKHPMSALRSSCEELLALCEQYLGPMLAGGAMTRARAAMQSIEGEARSNPQPPAS